MSRHRFLEENLDLASPDSNMLSVKHSLPPSEPRERLKTGSTESKSAINSSCGLGAEGQQQQQHCLNPLYSMLK